MHSGQVWLVHQMLFRCHVIFCRNNVLLLWDEDKVKIADKGKGPDKLNFFAPRLKGVVDL